MSETESLVFTAQHRAAHGTETQLYAYCPGCEGYHALPVDGPRAWTWNGSLSAPTLSPSVLVNGPHPESRCHSYIRDGKWQFLSDCHHEFAGQTVPIPVEERPHFACGDSADDQ